MSFSRADRVSFRRPDPAELAMLSTMLGEAMSENPNHRSAFGPDREHRVRRHAELMRAMLGRISTDHMSAAFSDARAVGFIAATVSPQCHPLARELAGMAPRLLRLGPRSLVNVVRWQRAWLAEHPPYPHLHVGPLAVIQEYRGAGVGRRLLADAVAEATRRRLPAYLETDKAGNVEWYRRAGFSVRSTELVMGRPNWFMVAG